jgi:hypothetical protein
MVKLICIPPERKTKLSNKKAMSVELRLKIKINRSGNLKITSLVVAKPHNETGIKRQK